MLLTHWADVTFNNINKDHEYRIIDWDPKDGELVDIHGDPKGATEADRRDDSSVVMYWPDKELQQGEHRDVGFAYGLGYVASAEGGKLALTAGDPGGVGATFDVTAFTTDPTPGQTVTLVFPPGLQVVGGNVTQLVPQPPAGAADARLSVAWKVKATKPGQYVLQAQSNLGAIAPSNPVNIPPPPDTHIDPFK